MQGVPGLREVRGEGEAGREGELEGVLEAEAPRGRELEGVLEAEAPWGRAEPPGWVVPEMVGETETVPETVPAAERVAEPESVPVAQPVADSVLDMLPVLHTVVVAVPEKVPEEEGVLVMEGVPLPPEGLRVRLRDTEVVPEALTVPAAREGVPVAQVELVGVPVKVTVAQPLTEGLCVAEGLLDAQALMEGLCVAEGLPVAV